jgi:Fibronectin type III domain
LRSAGHPLLSALCDRILPAVAVNPPPSVGNKASQGLPNGKSVEPLEARRHLSASTPQPFDLGIIGSQPVNFAFDIAPKSKDIAMFAVTSRSAIQIDTIHSKGMKRNDMTLELRDKDRVVYSTSLRPDRLTGRAIVHPVLSPGKYTLTMRNNSQIIGKMVSGVRVSPFAAPSRLEASVWGGKTIRLNWNDNSGIETGYVVDKKVDGKWVRAATADANATAAVVDGLELGTRYQFRVTAIAGNQQVSGMNLVAASTSTEDTTGWYKVSSLSGATKAYASWTIKSGKLDFGTDDSGSFQDRWVYANSWHSAVASSIEGSVTVRRGDGSSPPPHTFASEGSFKIGTGAEIKPTVTDFKLPANDTKMIVLEDSYGEVDRDYDDFWWSITISGPVNMKQIRTISNQFGDSRDDNFLANAPSTSFSGSVSDYLIMSANLNDRGALRVDLEFTGSAPDIISFKNSIFFGIETWSSLRDKQVPGLRPQWRLGGSAESDTAAIDFALNQIAISNMSGPVSENPIECRISLGFPKDLAQYEGMLEPDELVFRGAHKVIIVHQSVVDRTRSELILAASLAPFAGYGPIAADWLASWCNDLPFTGSVSVMETLVLPDSRLSHHTGADWGVSPNIRKSTFTSGDGTIIPRSVATSAEVMNAIRTTAWRLRNEIMENPPEFGDTITLDPVPLQDPMSTTSSVLTSIQLAANDDLKRAINNARVNFAASFTLKTRRVAEPLGDLYYEVYVEKVRLVGQLADLYDFNYSDGGWAESAAIVQASHGVLGTFGRLVKVEINLDENIGLDYPVAAYVPWAP